MKFTRFFVRQYRGDADFISHLSAHLSELAQPLRLICGIHRRHRGDLRQCPCTKAVIFGIRCTRNTFQAGILCSGTWAEVVRGCRDWFGGCWIRLCCCSYCTPDQLLLSKFSAGWAWSFSFLEAPALKIHPSIGRLLLFVKLAQRLPVLRNMRMIALESFPVAAIAVQSANYWHGCTPCSNNSGAINRSSELKKQGWSPLTFT